MNIKVIKTILISVFLNACYSSAFCYAFPEVYVDSLGINVSLPEVILGPDGELYTEEPACQFRLPNQLDAICIRRRTLYLWNGGLISFRFSGNENEIHNDVPEFLPIDRTLIDPYLNEFISEMKAGDEEKDIRNVFIRILKKTLRKKGDSLEIKYKGYIIYLIKIPEYQYEILYDILETFNVSEMTYEFPHYLYGK